MQDTINSFAFGEDVIELMETSENEDNEKEFKEEIEFFHKHEFYSINAKFSALINYNPYCGISSYNSPIMSVLTPPPDFNS